MFVMVQERLIAAIVMAKAKKYVINAMGKAQKPVYIVLGTAKIVVSDALVLDMQQMH